MKQTRCFAAAVLLSLVTGLSAQGQLSESDRATLVKRLDGRAEHFAKVSRQIWEFAEVGYQETKSAALLKEELRAAGFAITESIGNIPTAFSAQAGSGAPVIGILGEYDALPGLWQEPVPMRKPERSTKAGHGCGHNLFGAASAAAAIAVKEWLAEKGMKGTVRFYGCPAEEGGGGKIYMARAGAFNDCDAVLHWHPGSENRASLKTNLANMTGKFRFRGMAAHAAGAPDKGRSALDAVMLFAHAVDLLREHVPQTTRMHYVITSGGDAPNVVPAFSEV
jgi:aminobenzoyl-glutamate utilization protein B